MDELPEPREWSSEDWRNFTDSWRSRLDLLGTEIWTKLGAIILSIGLLIWGIWRRRILLQFGR